MDHAPTNDEEAAAFMAELLRPPTDEEMSYEAQLGAERDRDAAPKRRRRRKDTAPTDTPSLGDLPAGPRMSRRETRLVEFYSSIGMAVMLFNQFDGQVLLMGARDRAHELAMVCKEYPDIGKWVDRLLSGSVWTAFVMGHGAMALAILSNHGMIPANLMSRFQQPGETAA